MSDMLHEEELRRLLEFGELTPTLSQRMASDVAVRGAVARLVRSLAVAADLATEPPMPTLNQQRLSERLYERLAPVFDRATPMALGAPLRLAASTGYRPAAVGGGMAAVVFHAAFVEPTSARGHIRPIIVEAARFQSDEGADIQLHTDVDCDAVMHMAALRAVRSARASLRRLGWLAGPHQNIRVSWGIGGPPAYYEGASIGLALALATVAAIAGYQPPLNVAASGVVDDGQLGSVDGIEQKWEAMQRIGLATVVFPSVVTDRFPPGALAVREPRLLLPNSLDDAIIKLFGGPLGLISQRLAAATAPIPDTTPPHLEIWLTAPPAPAARSVSVEPRRRPDQWFIGDELSIQLRCDQPVFLALLDHGTSGGVTMLLPNASSGAVRLEPGKTFSYPAPGAGFSFRLGGPPGVERLIALACREPIPVPAMQQWIQRFESDDLANQITRRIGPVAARAEVEFSLCEPPAPATRGVDLGSMPVAEQWLVVDF